MCEPTTILTAASFAVTAGSALANHQSQKKAAETNKESAEAGLKDTWASLDLRGQQEQEATAQSVMSIDRQARTQRSLAALAAGESGVSGASVDALLNELTSEELQAKLVEKRNLDMTQDQIQQEKASGYATEQSRINSVANPNPFLTGLQIAGAGLNAGTQIWDRRHPGGK